MRSAESEKMDSGTGAWIPDFASSVPRLYYMEKHRISIIIAGYVHNY